ncbi:MAG: type II toxin-antitoxin system VapC family toxin [Terrimicrobiaceae bacterium]
MNSAEDVTVIFDTDIFIWVQRGNVKAAQLIENEEERLLSLQTYLELLQCAENRRQHEQTKSFLKDFGFLTLPLTENIGHRAAVYIEEYAMSHGLRAGDAIVAATAAENSLTLCTGNGRHFKPITDLKIRVFKPCFPLALRG